MQAVNPSGRYESTEPSERDVLGSTGAVELNTGAPNPLWLAFFREVRRLAELARQRESQAADHHQPAALFSNSVQTTLPAHSP